MSLETIKLTRDPTPYDDCTYGALYTGDVRLCDTLELPWADNAPGESCIPPGTYLCVPHNSAKFPRTWEVTGIPGRSAVLIHWGNDEDDTDGCIIVGSSRGMVGDEHAVLNSRATYDMLRASLPEQFYLQVL